MNVLLKAKSSSFSDAFAIPNDLGPFESSSAFSQAPRKSSGEKRIYKGFRLASSQSITLTDNLVRFSAPDQMLAAEYQQKAAQSKADRQHYVKRISALMQDALHDGYTVRPTSELGFWQFVRKEPMLRRGSLVLLDNGNLRLVWKDAHGSHVGLQFLGLQTLQFVIFKRRSGSAAVSRVVGRDNFDGLRKQIQAFDLRGLVYA